MANVPPLGPQPDFAAMTASYQSLADESAKMQNAPGLAANGILAHLQAMEQRINTRFDQVEAKLLAR